MSSIESSLDNKLSVIIVISITQTIGIGKVAGTVIDSWDFSVAQDFVKLVVVSLQHNFYH